MFASSLLLVFKPKRLDLKKIIFIHFCRPYFKINHNRSFYCSSFVLHPMLPLNNHSPCLLVVAWLTCRQVQICARKYMLFRCIGPLIEVQVYLLGCVWRFCRCSLCPIVHVEFEAHFSNLDVGDFTKFFSLWIFLFWSNLMDKINLICLTLLTKRPS